MEFNPGKCQVIRVTRARTPIPTQNTLHGQTLEVLLSARYLGVDIASDLSWKPHIASIANSANKSLGFLRRNLKAKSPELREIAYKAIVRPQLEYTAPVWDPHIQEDIQRIEVVQRQAARWVLSDYSPYSSVSDMLGRLGWCTLEQWRVDSRLVLFYKIVHGLNPTLYIRHPLQSLLSDNPPISIQATICKNWLLQILILPIGSGTVEQSFGQHCDPDKSWQLQIGCQSGVPPQTINLNTSVFILTFSCFHCIIH